MTDDILKRLREQKVTVAIYGPTNSEMKVKNPTELELEAADEIEKLRAALKPFAIAADEIAYSGTDFDELTSLWHWHDLPTLRDLRAAKAALGEK